jgi:ribosomal protein S18 acetylase RimI-like enzyme
MVFRRSTRKDSAQLSRLSLAHLSRKSKEEFAKSNPKLLVDHGRLFSGEVGACFVAETQTRIVGYVAGRPLGNRPDGLSYFELEQLSVAPPYQRRGLGRKLTQMFISWSIESGADVVAVTTHIGNISALKFYHLLGFRPNNVELEHRAPRVEHRNGSPKSWT